MLAGLLSIVASLIAYGLIVGTIGGFSALSGGMSLGLLLFPTITRTTGSVVRMVPDSLHEAGLALGLAQWRMVPSLVLPTTASGIAAAVILGIVRVAGETAPLLFTSFGSSSVPTGIMQPVSVLPFSIWVNSQVPDQQSYTLAWVGAIIPMAFVLVLEWWRDC